MSRNASGTFTLASGNPVISGTTITIAWANGTLSDIGTEITDSLDRSGKGGMLAGFKAFSGTASLPGWSWDSETASGVYRVSAGLFRWRTSGVTLQEWQASGNVDFAKGMSATGLTAGVGGTFTGGTTGSGVSGTGGATNGIGVLGTGGGSTSGIGVKGVTAGSGEGVWGSGGGSGIGGRFVGGTTAGIGLVADRGASSGSSPILIVPSAAPTTNLTKGCLYVTTAGVLMIYDGAAWGAV